MVTCVGYILTVTKCDAYRHDDDHQIHFCKNKLLEHRFSSHVLFQCLKISRHIDPVEFSVKKYTIKNKLSWVYLTYLRMLAYNKLF